ncbi:MAG: hypothetical protein ABTD50_19360 [Polyangiaceae bacterium]|jgi:hypothetical protein
MNTITPIPDIDDPLLTRAELCAESTGELVAIARQLGPDERRVLSMIARRLLDGRGSYGPLDCVADPRDWRAEGAEEALDLSVYLACELLRRG